NPAVANKIITQLKIQSSVYPKFSAIIVPKRGEVMKAIENEIPFSPIYEPRLNILERLTATVEANGIIRISEMEIRKMDIYKIQTVCVGINIKKDKPQNKLPIIIVLESVNFFSA